MEIRCRLSLIIFDVPKVLKWRNDGCCGVSIIVGGCGCRGSASTRLKSVGHVVSGLYRVVLRCAGVPAHDVAASFGYVFVYASFVDCVFSTRRRGL